MIIRVRFDRSLSSRAGISMLEFRYDRCVKVRDILNDICRAIPDIDRDSILVFSRDRLLTLDEEICEDTDIEITESVLGG